MSLIDALETENTQALGALIAVTAQRDRLLAYVRAERRLRSCPPSLRRARLHLQYQAALRALRDAGDVTADDAQRDLGDAA